MKQNLPNKVVRYHAMSSCTLNKLNNKIARLIAFLYIALAGFSSTSIAQTQEDRKEKIEAMKVAFITQKLDLSSKEAQVFWPLYNDYQDKLQALRKQKV